MRQKKCCGKRYQVQTQGMLTESARLTLTTFMFLTVWNRTGRTMGRYRDHRGKQDRQDPKGKKVKLGHKDHRDQPEKKAILAKKGTKAIPSLMKISRRNSWKD